LCIEAPKLIGKRHAHPEVSLHTHPFSDYVRLMEADRWDGVAALMLSSEKKLAAAGADLIICPDNTIHRVFDEVVAQACRPWLHIAEEVAKEAKSRGYSRVALLGTSYTMEGAFYTERLARNDIAVCVPGEKDRKLIDGIIFDELVASEFTNESRTYLNAVIDGLRKNENCEAVILGCTEIPLIINDETSPLPVLDSTRLLARAALKVSLEANNK